MNMRLLALMLVVAAVTAAKAQNERRMTVDDLFQLVESNSKTLQKTKISVEFRFANYFHNGSAFQFAVNPIARTSAIGYFASKALTSEVKWLFESILLSQYAMQHSWG